MTMTKDFRIDPLHPSLSGHFPGNPIVPGVVLLGEVLEALEQSLSHPVVVSKVPVVKFHSPLRPNELAQLRFDLLPEKIITFSCHVGSRQVASGQFIFGANDQAPSQPP